MGAGDIRSGFPPVVTTPPPLLPATPEAPPVAAEALRRSDTAQGDGIEEMPRSGTSAAVTTAPQVELGPTRATPATAAPTSAAPVLSEVLRQDIAFVQSLGAHPTREQSTHFSAVLQRAAASEGGVAAFVQAYAVAVPEPSLSEVASRIRPLAARQAAATVLAQALQALLPTPPTPQLSAGPASGQSLASLRATHPEVAALMASYEANGGRARGSGRALHRQHIEPEDIARFLTSGSPQPRADGTNPIAAALALARSTGSWTALNATLALLNCQRALIPSRIGALDTVLDGLRARLTSAPASERDSVLQQIVAADAERAHWTRTATELTALARGLPAIAEGRRVEWAEHTVARSERSIARAPAGARGEARRAHALAQMREAERTISGVARDVDMRLARRTTERGVELGVRAHEGAARAALAVAQAGHTLPTAAVDIHLERAEALLPSVLGRTVDVTTLTDAQLSQRGGHLRMAEVVTTARRNAATTVLIASDPVAGPVMEGGHLMRPAAQGREHDALLSQLVSSQLLLQITDGAIAVMTTQLARGPLHPETSAQLIAREVAGREELVRLRETQAPILTALATIRADELSARESRASDTADLRAARERRDALPAAHTAQVAEVTRRTAARDAAQAAVDHPLRHGMSAPDAAHQFAEANARLAVEQRQLASLEREARAIVGASGPIATLQTREPTNARLVAGAAQAGRLLDETEGVALDEHASDFTAQRTRQARALLTRADAAEAQAAGVFEAAPAAERAALAPSEARFLLRRATTETELGRLDAALTVRETVAAREAQFRTDISRPAFAATRARIASHDPAMIAGADAARHQRIRQAGEESGTAVQVRRAQTAVAALTRSETLRSALPLGQERSDIQRLGAATRAEVGVQIAGVSPDAAQRLFEEGLAATGYVMPGVRAPTDTVADTSAPGVPAALTREGLREHLSRAVLGSVSPAQRASHTSAEATIGAGQRMLDLSRTLASDGGPLAATSAVRAAMRTQIAGFDHAIADLVAQARTHHGQLIADRARDHLVMEGVSEETRRTAGEQVSWLAYVGDLMPAVQLARFLYTRDTTHLSTRGVVEDEAVSTITRDARDLETQYDAQIAQLDAFASGLSGAAARGQGLAYLDALSAYDDAHGDGTAEGRRRAGAALSALGVSDTRTLLGPRGSPAAWDPVLQTTLHGGALRFTSTGWHAAMSDVAQNMTDYNAHSALAIIHHSEDWQATVGDVRVSDFFAPLGLSDARQWRWTSQLPSWLQVVGSALNRPSAVNLAAETVAIEVTTAGIGSELAAARWAERLPAMMRWAERAPTVARWAERASETTASLGVRFRELMPVIQTAGREASWARRLAVAGFDGAAVFGRGATHMVATVAAQRAASHVAGYVFGRDSAMRQLVDVAGNFAFVGAADSVAHAQSQIRRILMNVGIGEAQSLAPQLVRWYMMRGYGPDPALSAAENERIELYGELVSQIIAIAVPTSIGLGDGVRGRRAARESVHATAEALAPRIATEGGAPYRRLFRALEQQLAVLSDPTQSIAASTHAIEGLAALTERPGVDHAALARLVREQHVAIAMRSAPSAPSDMPDRAGALRAYADALRAHLSAHVPSSARPAIEDAVQQHVRAAAVASMPAMALGSPATAAAVREMLERRTAEVVSRLVAAGVHPMVAQEAAVGIVFNTLAALAPAAADREIIAREGTAFLQRHPPHPARETILPPPPSANEPRTPGNPALHPEADAVTEPVSEPAADTDAERSTLTDAAPFRDTLVPGDAERDTLTEAAPFRDTLVPEAATQTPALRALTDVMMELRSHGTPEATALAAHLASLSLEQRAQLTPALTDAFAATLSPVRTSEAPDGVLVPSERAIAGLQMFFAAPAATRAVWLREIEAAPAGSRERALLLGAIAAGVEIAAQPSADAPEPHYIVCLPNGGIGMVTNFDTPPPIDAATGLPRADGEVSVSVVDGRGVWLRLTRRMNELSAVTPMASQAVARGSSGQTERGMAVGVARIPGEPEGVAHRLVFEASTRRWSLDTTADFHDDVQGISAVGISHDTAQRFERARSALSVADRATLDGFTSRARSAEEQLLIIRTFGTHGSLEAVAQMQRMLGVLFPEGPASQTALLRVATADGLVQYYRDSCALTASQYARALASPLDAMVMVARGSRLLLAEQVRGLTSAQSEARPRRETVIQAVVGGGVHTEGAAPTFILNSASGSAGLYSTQAEVQYNQDLARVLATDGVTLRVAEGPRTASSAAELEAALWQSIGDNGHTAPEGVLISVAWEGGGAHALTVLRAEAAYGPDGVRDPARTTYFIRDPHTGLTVRRSGEQLIAGAYSPDSPLSRGMLTTVARRMITTSGGYDAPQLEHAIRGQFFGTIEPSVLAATQALYMADGSQQTAQFSGASVVNGELVYRFRTAGGATVERSAADLRNPALEPRLAESPLLRTLVAERPALTHGVGIEFDTPTGRARYNVSEVRIEADGQTRYIMRQEPAGAEIVMTLAQLTAGHGPGWTLSGVGASRHPLGERPNNPAEPARAVPPPPRAASATSAGPTEETPSAALTNAARDLATAPATISATERAGLERARDNAATAVAASEHPDSSVDLETAAGLRQRIERSMHRFGVRLQQLGVSASVAFHRAGEWIRGVIGRRLSSAQFALADVADQLRDALRDIPGLAAAFAPRRGGGVGTRPRPATRVAEATAPSAAVASTPVPPAAVVEAVVARPEIVRPEMTLRTPPLEFAPWPPPASPLVPRVPVVTIDSLDESLREGFGLALRELESRGGATTMQLLVVYTNQLGRPAAIRAQANEALRYLVMLRNDQLAVAERPQIVATVEGALRGVSPELARRVRSVLEDALMAHQLRGQTLAGESFMTAPNGDRVIPAAALTHVQALRREVQTALQAAGVAPAEAQRLALRAALDRMIDSHLTSGQPITVEGLAACPDNLLPELTEISRLFVNDTFVRGFLRDLADDVSRELERLPQSQRQRDRTALLRVIERRAQAAGLIGEREGPQGQRSPRPTTLHGTSETDFMRAMASGMFFDFTFEGTEHGIDTHAVGILAALEALRNVRSPYSPTAFFRELASTPAGRAAWGTIFDGPPAVGGLMRPERLGALLRDALSDPVETRTIVDWRRESSTRRDARYNALLDASGVPRGELQRAEVLRQFRELTRRTPSPADTAGVAEMRARRREIVLRAGGDPALTDLVWLPSRDGVTATAPDRATLIRRLGSAEHADRFIALFRVLIADRAAAEHTQAHDPSALAESVSALARMGRLLATNDTQGLSMLSEGVMARGRSVGFASEAVLREQMLADLTSGRIDATQMRRLMMIAGGSRATDAVTGFNAAVLREPTLVRAQQLLAADPEATGYYLEADLQNLSGLNAALGNSQANTVYTRIAEIFRAELERAGGDLSLFRHGGDEVSAVIVGHRLTPERVRVALERAQERVAAYVREAHVSVPGEGGGTREVALRDITHPKHPADRVFDGTGISVGMAEISDAPMRDVFNHAAEQVESDKRRRGLRTEPVATEAPARVALVAPPASAAAIAPGLFATPVATRRAAFISEATRLDPSLTTAAAAELFTRAGGEDIDPTTGFELRGARMPTVERALAHVRATPSAHAFYIEGDIRNLAGLNAACGFQNASEVFGAMTAIMRRHLQAIGADVACFRHGGDEVSAVVVGPVTQAQVDTALSAARREMGAMASTSQVARGSSRTTLASIPHPKHPGDARFNGTGMVFGVTEMMPGTMPDAVRARELVAVADRAVELAKHRGQAGTSPLGTSPPGLSEPVLSETE